MLGTPLLGNDRRCEQGSVLEPSTTNLEAVQGSLHASSVAGLRGAAGRSPAREAACSKTAEEGISLRACTGVMGRGVGNLACCDIDSTHTSGVYTGRALIAAVSAV